jgi:hypothetical protein
MFIPSALRYGIGTDYFSYVSIFKAIANNRYTDIEIGYKLLNQLWIALNLDVQFVFAAMSFFTFLFLFLAVPRKSFYIIIPFYFVIQYGFSYNVVRQALVITMAYYAYQLFDKKKILRAFFCIIIAFFFHKSAAVYILLFLLMMIFNIQKKYAVVIFIMILASFTVADKIIVFLFDLIISNTPYARYINSKYVIATERHSFLGVVSTFLMLSATLLFMPNIRDKKTSNAFIVLLFYTVSQVLANIILIFYRFVALFIFGWLVGINHINIHRGKYRKIILLMLYCWEWFYFIFSLRNGINEITPYRTIFSK